MSRNENRESLTICLVSEQRLLVCLLVVLTPRLTSLVSILYSVAMAVRSYKLRRNKGRLAGRFNLFGAIMFSRLYVSFSIHLRFEMFSLGGLKLFFEKKIIDPFDVKRICIIKLKMY